MSDSARLPSKDVKGWLERETRSLFIPIHSKAQRLSDEMAETIDSLSDSSRMLLENSQKEIEKRNPKTYGRARALNKLARLFVERMRQIHVLDKVTYDSFGEFVQETQRAFVATDADVRNWFPRISPYFILDRRKFQIYFEKAKLSLRELSNFQTKEYVKAKTLEQTFQLIERLQALEMQLVNLKEQKARVENEKSLIESEAVEIRKRMNEMRSKGGLGQLSQAGTEIESLSAEVKQSLQHLQKPFVKLQSLATHGEGSGLAPEELSKLNHYVENPFEAFATEEAGHPLLRHILQKLNRVMSEGKLKLKPEKTRKAEQVIENILSRNSLADLHQRSMNVVTQRKQLSASTEVAEAEKELSKLRDRLEEQERKRKIVEGEQVTLERACNENAEKIRSLKSDIERNVLEFMNRKINIE